MAISLIKGQTIDLRKNEKGEDLDLSTVTIGLGWDVRQKPARGISGKLFGGVSREEYDLDAIAFLLDANGKVADPGRKFRNASGMDISMYQGDVIYFNSMKHPSGHIWLTGDNRTGEGDGDDEQIIVKLNALDQKYQDRIRHVHLSRQRECPTFWDDRERLYPRGRCQRQRDSPL